MGGRILAVDDEKDMLALLRRIIGEETDHELVTESDPLQALERFKTEPFDLVISDLKMPRMDGLRLLEAVREYDPQAAVILMTAYGTIETAVEATRKGAHDFITKPFRRERILVTVEKVMQWRQMAKENERLREALAHLEEYGRDVEDFWDGEHARKVAACLRGYAPGVEVLPVYMGDQIRL